MKTLRRCPWLTVAAILVFVLLLQSNQVLAGANTVNVAIATWAGFASGFVGKEKGFFDGISVNFTVMDDSRARHAAFLSGRIDIMISSADVFAQELAQGINGVIVIVTDESWGGDGVVAAPEIKTLADLKGRRVAFARATPSHYFLFKALEKAGLSPKDINPVIVEDPGHAGQAFVGGSVDAAVTWEPFLTQVRESGKGRILVTTKDFPGTVVDVLIASPQFAGKKDLLRRFTQGWLRSVEYVESHTEESANIIAKNLNIPPEEATGMMAGLRFAGMERNRYFLCEPSPQKPHIIEILKDAALFWKSQEIISAVPSTDGVCTAILCDLDAKPK